MEPDPLLFLALVLGLLLFAGFMAFEIALVSAWTEELAKRRESWLSQMHPVDQMLKRTPQLLLTMALMRNLGVMVATVATVLIIFERFSTTFLISSLLLLWLLLALIRVLSRVTVLEAPERFALRLASPARIAMILLWPLTFLLGKTAHKFVEELKHAQLKDLFLSQDGLHLLIESHKTDSYIEDSEKEMIASIMELNDTVVREVMIPRIDMVTVSLNSDVEEVLSIIIQEGHSRIPVYSENIDNIVGMVYAKDLLHFFHKEKKDVALKSILRPVQFIPESKKINVLFREMQARKVHIAVVIDEYGGIAGLVTIEDLLEEIVGEIEDEYDSEQEILVQRIRTNAYVLNSRLCLDDLEKLLNISIAERSADTLGGFIYLLSGHLPAQGEVLSYGNWSFTVLSIDGHRIEQVRAEMLTTQNNSAAAESHNLASCGDSVFNYR